MVRAALPERAETGRGPFRTYLRWREGPISKARGYYWLGRAAEAGATGTARDYYAQAARYDVAFYGQLAAAKLGQKTLQVNFPSRPEEERARFASRHAVQAIDRLEAAGHEARRQLYLDLAGELTSAGELALLAVKGERAAAIIWACGSARSLLRGPRRRCAGPSDRRHPGTHVRGAGKALAYAVARQESEFNAGAVSRSAPGAPPADAGHGEHMARKAGLSYSPQRLTSDSGYNAILGAHYLGEQLDRFDGSMILTFAGYNAGPSRAAEWAQRYGDPRSMSVEDAVDWVERIPYTETRNYVQRVMENYQVYRMRLTGHVNIVGDLTAGTPGG